MAILVTGGAGFIGSHLCEYLVSQGTRTLCLDNFNDFYSPAIKRANIQPLLKTQEFVLIEGDIRDSSTLKDTFTTHDDIDIVVHLAAMAGVRPSIADPALYIDVNVTGTNRLLDACKQAQVKRFIFGSSSSVYGITNTIPFNEHEALDKPVSPYAATKIAGEALCHVYHNLYNIPMACLRFFTVYGPRQRPEMAIHKFTRAIYEKKAIPMYGNGSSTRDYTYITDIMDGVRKSLELTNGFEILNLGNSNTTDLRTLISIIERELGMQAKVNELPAQAGDVPVTYADITKARQVLGYAPSVPIEDGIRKFVAWFLEQNRERNSASYPGYCTS